MTKLKLGNVLRDKVTGFEGIALGKAKYLTGCDQFCLQPKAKGGDYIESRWFDAGRLEFVGESFNKKDVKGEENGCDVPPPSVG